MPEEKQTVELSRQEKLKKTKEMLKKDFSFKEHPDYIITEFERILEEYKKNPKENSEKLESLYPQVIMALGLDTHIPVIYAARDEYRPLVVEITNSLTEEFNVKTVSEKILVQTIANSYVRIMVLSRQLTSTLRLETASQNINGFYTAVSKDLDRAHRQFVSAFTLLKELKSPSLNINIKTNTAFVAQNQQLNNTPYENNTP